MNIMKFKIWLISAVIISALTSCDDGDLIVTSFDFEDQDLQYCGGESSVVFFKINDEAQESLSLNIAGSSEIFIESDIDPISLSATNFVSYRKFNGDVDASYFCTSVPPATPQVISEYLAESGTATLTNSLVLDDDDGVPFEAEYIFINGVLLDTDNDGIPNYYDSDDDGDNVPTRNELDFTDADGDGDPLTNPLDTDGDEVPNYLDNDDDGDDLLTINESTDGNLTPLDDRNDPLDPNLSDFLNDQVTITGTEITTYIQHSYNRNSTIAVVLTNVTFSNSDETIVEETIDMGIKSNVINDTFSGTPEFVEQ